MQMVMFTRASGRMTRLMDMASTCIPMAHNMKDSGKKTSSMEKVKRHGLMVLSTKEIILRVKRTVLESLDGLMVLLMKDNSLITTSMVRGSTFGPTLASMTENG